MNGMRRYVLIKPDGKPTDPMRLGTLMLRARLRSRKGHGPWHLNGGGPEAKRSALDGFEVSLRRAHVGEFQRLEDSKTLAIRAKPVHVKVSILRTDGNYKVDRYFGAMHDEFGKLNVFGVTVCKTIGTTSTPSQHSDWPPLQNWKQAGFPSREQSAGGNAIDLNASKRTMKAMFHASINRANELDVENVIHWPFDSPHPLIWNPEQGIHVYDVPPGGSNHSDHVHGDFRPSRTGQTRC